MSAEVSSIRRVVNAAMVMVVAGLLGIGLTVRAADAQTAGVQITQFPGVTYDYLGPKGETHTFTTTCPAGFYAISGGWSTQGTADFVVVDSYPSSLPYTGQGGTWELTIRKTTKGPLTVTPYVTCLSGATQLPE